MSEIVDRYHQAGLKSNPFAGENGLNRHHELFVDRGLPDPPPANAATVVQLIGDKGAGKTSQVMAWRHRAPGPYHYVPPRPYRDRWSPPPVAPIVYGDEIDRMPAMLRRSWFRRLAQTGATLIIGTHTDLASPARRAGFLVVTHKLGPTDLALLQRVFERRFDAVAIDGCRSLSLSDDQIAAIHRASGGSLRVAEVLAHEAVAHSVSAFPVERTVSP